MVKSLIVALKKVLLKYNWIKKTYCFLGAQFGYQFPKRPGYVGHGMNSGCLGKSSQFRRYVFQKTELKLFCTCVI